MPEIITGRAHSGRRDIFFARVLEAAEKGCDVLVIVPDQYSFEMDKELYDRLGVKLFNSIETSGISALCDKLCRELGGSAAENADDRTRLMAMYRAQSRLAADKNCGLGIFRRSLLKPSFVSQCITLVRQLMHSGVTPETLRAAAETSPTGAVRLSDTAIIFTAYTEELAKMGLSDSASLTARAAALAKDSGSFKGRTVFFDGFNSFSADELMLVGAVIASAAGTVFSVVCGEHQTDSSDPFAQTRRTISRIERIAQDCNRSVSFTRACGCGQSAPLAAVNTEYFSYCPKKTGSEGLVKVCTATDIYEESDYICSEIVRLAREEGYRLSETAVICGALAESSRVLTSACERYGIPYFVDMSESAIASIPAKYLMSILDAALTKTYRTDNILRIVKSPLSDFFYYDAHDLENFCIQWNVEGDMWKEPFIIDGQDRSTRVDDSRKKIIEPLERFRNACNAPEATVGTMCEALYALLDELKMSEKVYSKVRIAMRNETDTEVTRSLKQVWLGLVETIRSIYEQMKDEKLTLREFTELLKLSLGTLTLSSPPQKADCLLIGDADRTRLSGVRALFIMQANDGIFPAGVKRSELLGESDISALERIGTDIELAPSVCLDSERMQVYSGVTAPAERLYVSYSESDRTGGISAPSTLPTALRSLFEDDIRVKLSELPQEFFCTSYRTAYYKYLEHSREKTQSTANILSSLSASAEYSARIENAERLAEPQKEKISAELAKQLFFRHDLNISATRVSDYYKCPFSYFCKYGLRLSSPSAVGITPQVTGNIAHACLERVMSVPDESGRRVYNKDFPRLSDEDLMEIIDICTDEYIADELGGDYGKPLSFKLAAERLKQSILHRAINFREEMKGSLFIPAAFEYDLSGENGIGSVMSFDVDGERVNLRGMIDRADLYRSDGIAWLRIIDYKTGAQTFDESEVYNGLDLQMLIYLLAATTAMKGLAQEGETIAPSGIMYSHIKFVSPKLDDETVAMLEEEGVLEERLMLERAKEYKPDGMMLGEEIYEGLNRENDGVYTIFRFNKDLKPRKDSVQPVTQNKLLAMEKFALGKVEQMALRLKKGDISSDPIQMKNGRLPCSYCDFKGVCRNPDPKDPRSVTPEDKDRLAEELEKLMSEPKANN